MIVTANDAGPRSTLRALKLKSLKDIPDHIPVVKWDWVVACANKRTFESDYGKYAIFSEKIYDIGSTFRKPLGNNTSSQRTHSDLLSEDGEFPDASGEFSRALYVFISMLCAAKVKSVDDTTL